MCVENTTRLSYTEILSNERVVTVTAFAERAAAFFASPGVSVERIMTDDGSGYVSDRFADSMGRLGIRHIRPRPYRPETNGKAARFIRWCT